MTALAQALSRSPWRAPARGSGARDGLISHSQAPTPGRSSVSAKRPADDYLGESRPVRGGDQRARHRNRCFPHCRAQERPGPSSAHPLAGTKETPRKTTLLKRAAVPDIMGHDKASVTRCQGVAGRALLSTPEGAAYSAKSQDRAVGRARRDNDADWYRDIRHRRPHSPMKPDVTTAWEGMTSWNAEHRAQAMVRATRGLSNGLLGSQRQLVAPLASRSVRLGDAAPSEPSQRPASASTSFPVVADWEPSRWLPLWPAEDPEHKC